jgi:hypothetical protein
VNRRSFLRHFLQGAVLAAGAKVFSFPSVLTPLNLQAKTLLIHDVITLELAHDAPVFVHEELVRLFIEKISMEEDQRILAEMRGMSFQPPEPPAMIDNRC